MSAHAHAGVWDDVVGQHALIERLERAAAHPAEAYLFVGPRGSTKWAAARAFAALVLGGSDGPTSRDVALARRGEHPDITEVVRSGPAISAPQAREIVRTASLAPNEGARKVMLLDDFHLVRPDGAALLLKTIEEPPDSTTFVICADFVPHDLVTISSRCARIDFVTIDDATVAARLVEEGADAESAAEAAAAAHGDLDRARVLAADPALARRRRAFAEVPRRLDGTGATVMQVVDELMAMVDDAAEPLKARHLEEIAAVDERAARFGERGSGRKALDERHRRELRRHRTDELLAGLTAVAATYRDALVGGEVVRPDSIADGVRHIHDAIEVFERNPNEPLLLQSLLWQLPVLDG